MQGIVERTVKRGDSLLTKEQLVSIVKLIKYQKYMFLIFFWEIKMLLIICTDIFGMNLLLANIEK